MRHSYRLTEVRRADASDVGTKAATLGELLGSGFPVPAGVLLAVGEGDASEPELALLVEASRQLSGGALVVRSSAILEDRHDRSYAGRYATVLDVTGEPGLRAAVRAVLDSANGTPMAVLVQELVAADVAGVAFTANPVTGARNEIVVNAGHGLADRLAAGETTPEEWVIRDGRARLLNGPDEVLTAEEAIQVAALATRVAERLGTPQDIEWAIEDGTLYLLQARPITGLVEPVPVPLEVPPGFWRRDRSHVPLPCTPLTRSVDTDDDSLRRAFAAVGLLVELRLGTIGGWAYTSLQPVLGKAGTPAPPGWLMPLLVRLSPTARRLVRSCRRAVREDLAGRMTDRWYDEIRPVFRERIAGLREVELSALDDTGLIDHLHRARTLYADGSRAHFGVIMPTSLALAELAFTVRDLLGWDSGRVYDLFAGLSTRSSEPAWALSRAAGMAPDSAAYGAALAAYREVYGCRTLSVELAQPTLAEVAGLTDRLLREQAVTGYDPQAQTSALAAQREQAAQDARKSLRGAGRARFERALERATLAYPIREDNGFYTKEVPAALLRYAVLEAAHRLAARAQLDDADDVFLCEFAEITAALRDGDDRRPVVSRRRAERAWILAHPGPPSYGTDPGPPPSTRWLPRHTRSVTDSMIWVVEQILAGELSERSPQAGATVLTGVGASPGRYRGPARLIQSEDQFGKLRMGDVLVCPVTRPSWSVLFVSVGAVVTDAGGMLSHPAIIAREHRVPAVVATGHATAVLRDGQIVTVDGTSGRIEIES